MSCAEYVATVEDNVRLIELLMEVEGSDVWEQLPAWLRGAIEGEIEEAGSWRGSTIDRAVARALEGARQLAFTPHGEA